MEKLMCPVCGSDVGVSMLAVCDVNAAIDPRTTGVSRDCVIAGNYPKREFGGYCKRDRNHDLGAISRLIWEKFSHEWEIYVSGIVTDGTAKGKRKPKAPKTVYTCSECGGPVDIYLYVVCQIDTEIDEKHDCLSPNYSLYGLWLKEGYFYGFCKRHHDHVLDSKTQSLIEEERYQEADTYAHLIEAKGILGLAENGRGDLKRQQTYGIAFDAM